MLSIFFEFGRRHSTAFFEKSAKMGRFGEPEFIGDLLGGKPGEIKHSLGSGGDSRLDVFLGGFSDQGFDGPVEVVRADIHFFGVL